MRAGKLDPDPSAARLLDGLTVVVIGCLAFMRQCTDSRTHAQHPVGGCRAYTSSANQSPVAASVRMSPSLAAASASSGAIRNGTSKLEGLSEHALPLCASLEEHGLTGERSQYLGLYGERQCYAVQLGENCTVPEGWRFVGLRDAFGVFDVGLAALSGRAYQILEWDVNHRYCGRCGTATVPRKNERSRACPAVRPHHLSADLSCRHGAHHGWGTPRAARA